MFKLTEFSFPCHPDGPAAEFYMAARISLAGTYFQHIHRMFLTVQPNHLLRNMTIEDVLKRRMIEVLLKETPYVLEEARFGMFDIAVYVPEDSVFEGIGESKRLSAARACNRYQLDGICAEKKKTFLSSFEPVYDDHLLPEGFRNNNTGETFTEKDFNMMLADRKLMRANIACDIDDEGRGCEYLDNRLGWDSGFFGGNGLKKGLHLFEFKSDHDNVNRFLEQLPHYSMFADYVWLVLGSEQKSPKWLPSYVGIYREDGDSFIKLKESEYIARRPPLSQSVLKECGIPASAINDRMLYDFLRKWFINSIFYRENGLVMGMNELDHLFREYDKEPKKSRKQSRLF